jgi:type IV pilus assembly protein PilP
MKPLKTLLLAVAGWGVVLSACGDDAPPPAAAPQAKPKAAAAPTATAAATAPEMAAADAGTPAAVIPVYAYNPLGKRDPFRSYVEETKAGDARDGLCGEPLCQYDLEQLSLVAVVSGDSNPIAMVEDPSRVGHIIRRGTKIGKQGGQITQVLRDCVIVTEYWTGPDGKHQPNAVKICIKQDKDIGSLVQATDLLQKQLP